MLKINECLDKLTAMCSDFVVCGMLPARHETGRHASYMLKAQDDDEDEVDGGAIDENVVLRHVELACSRSKYCFSSSMICTNPQIYSPFLPTIHQWDCNGHR